MNEQKQARDSDIESKPVSMPAVKAEHGVPRFGLLLIVLILAVIFVVALTFASEALYS